MCGPLPKFLTLFITKICDFPYLIHDLTKNSILCSVITVAADTVALNIIFEDLLFMGLSIMMKKQLLLKLNTYPMQDEAKNNTLFKTKLAEKPYPLGSHIYIPP